MKKIILSAVAMVLMSTSAYSWTITGKIASVLTNAWGITEVVVLKDDNTQSSKVTIVGTVDGKKSMTAAALTAKASGSSVKVNTGVYNGESGVISITLE